MWPARRSANPLIVRYLLFASAESIARRAEVELDDLRAVEPVLAVVAAEDDSRRVPLADRRQALGAVRRDQIVQRARAMRRNLVVVVERVVDELILEAERGVVRRVLERELLGDVVLHAAVHRRRRLPIERELEIAERVDGHEVAAVRGLPVGHLRHVAARDLHDRAVDDLPVRGRHTVVSQPAPAGERLAVEQKAPALRAFGGGQRILRARGGRDDRCGGSDYDGQAHARNS